METAVTAVETAVTAVETAVTAVVSPVTAVVSPVTRRDALAVSPVGSRAPPRVILVILNAGQSASVQRLAVVTPCARRLPSQGAPPSVNATLPRSALPCVAPYRGSAQQRKPVL